MSARVPHAALVFAGLLAACGGPEPPVPTGRRAIETLPASRGGQDLLGLPFPVLEFDGWIDPEADAARSELSAHAHAADAGAPAPVTLYRWWTDTCPFCESSLPALETLRSSYARRGLRIVCVYHPKPARPVDPEVVRRAARERGFTGTLALDSDWSALSRLYLSTGVRDATSASFLVDAEGVIRFVHPGPVYHPSADPRDAQADADFRLLEQAVSTLLD